MAYDNLGSRTRVDVRGPARGLGGALRLLRAGAANERGEPRFYLAALDRLARLRRRYPHAHLNSPEAIPWQAPTGEDAARARQGLIDDVEWLDDIATRQLHRPAIPLAAILDSLADHILVLLRWATGHGQLHGDPVRGFA